MPIGIGGVGRIPCLGSPGTLTSPRPLPQRFARGLGIARPWNPQLPFCRPAFSAANTRIVGVTKDSAGTPIASCAVTLLLAGGDAVVARMTSDGAGNYAFDNPGSGPFRVDAYKAGSPDLAGTTVNTIVAV